MNQINEIKFLKNTYFVVFISQKDFFKWVAYSTHFELELLAWVRVWTSVDLLKLYPHRAAVSAAASSNAGLWWRLKIGPRLIPKHHRVHNGSNLVLPLLLGVGTSLQAVVWTFVYLHNFLEGNSHHCLKVNRHWFIHKQMLYHCRFSYRQWSETWTWTRNSILNWSMKYALSNKILRPLSSLTFCFNYSRVYQ